MDRSTCRVRPCADARTVGSVRSNFTRPGRHGRRLLPWLLLLLAGSVRPVHAENVVNVTTLADVVAAADGVVSLREAFDIANSDGDDTRIVLQAAAIYRLCGGDSTPKEDANVSGDLDYTDSRVLTIAGNGAQIRAACPGDRVLHALHPSGTLVLDNVRVLGGDLTDFSGGAGLLAFGNVVLQTTVFTDNTGGPAIERGEFGGPPGALTITGSSIDDNTSGIRINRGTATVTDSRVRFNQGDGIVANMSTVTVTRTQVRENAGRGVHGIDGSVTVIDSQIRDNGATGIRNTGNAPTGYPLAVQGTLVERNRGGIECSYCTVLSITGSTIQLNRPFADNTGGGGVALIANQPGITVTLSASTVVDNRAGHDGAGLRLRGTDGVVPVVTIDQSTIQGNRTTQVFADGGGIFAESIDLRIQNGSHVDANFAKPEGILVGGGGGGIAQRQGQLQVTASTISGNTAYDEGGGVSLFDVGSAVFTESTLDGNVATNFGGGAVQGAGTATLYRFDRVAITGNSARLAGGGIGISAGAGAPAIELLRSTLAGNQSTSSNGGGIAANGPSIALLLRNSTISGNAAASGQGGGILKIGGGSLTLRHATIAGNTGGAVANLLLGASAMDAFGSVVGDPLGGGADCSVAFGKVASGGYNFSGADTCGFGAGPGDIDAGGAPLLGALAANGGPTPTRLPLAGSALVGAIPPPSCTIEVNDQRGQPRPQGTGCEIGATEVVTGMKRIRPIRPIKPMRPEAVRATRDAACRGSGCRSRRRPRSAATGSRRSTTRAPGPSARTRAVRAR